MGASSRSKSIRSTPRLRGGTSLAPCFWERSRCARDLPLESLQKLIAAGEEPFDLIFIDADKEAYLEYFELSLKLSRPGTLIVADNVIRYGAVIDPDGGKSDARVAGIQRFLNALSKHPGVDATVIQSVGVKGHDGLALAIVK